MAELDFSAQSKDWASKIADKFGDKAGQQFLEVVLDLFESVEEILADLEVDEWDESALMDILHSDKKAYADSDMCITFYKILKLIIAGQYDTFSADAVLLPSDIMWDIDEKELVKAQKFMNMQCPGGGFSTSSENKNLFKIIAVGNKNQIELLTLIMDIYELAHIDEIISVGNEKRGFKNETAWAAKCKFFKTYNKNHADIIRRAIPEFKKRISGGGPTEMILNPIQDDINVYIQYVLMLQNIIKNILDTNKENICPAQIDLIILGRNHKADADAKNDEEDDDDDDEDFMATLTESMNFSSGNVPLVNTLPDYGLSGVLKKKNIDFITEKISIHDIAKTTRTIQQKIESKLTKSKEYGERIIVCIDRSTSGEDEKEAENDDLYIYQLGNTQWDNINANYNEMHLGWKTKTALLPNWKMNDDDLNSFIGGSTDFGDKGFVFSFHIHSTNRIYCDQWIKSQKLPFLPYQLIDVWPLYFRKDFRAIDKKFSYQYIYENWKLQTKDVRLNKWIEIIDPVFYKKLQKKHFKYMEQ